MELAMVGLGRMGLNMATRLLKGNHRVIAHDMVKDAIQKAEASGAEVTRSLEETKERLSRPRSLWIMVPSGDPTEETIARLAEILETDDIIIDGGNSNYKDSVRRAAKLREMSIHFVDVGTSVVSGALPRATV